MAATPLVLPDMVLNRPVVLDRDLPLDTVNQVERPFIESPLDGDEYLREAIGTRHAKEYRRLSRRLGEKGKLTIRSLKLEEFLALEASGWKGQRGSAMAVDRFRAAFAREAVTNLAARDLVCIHALELDGRSIAILVVFVEAGEAWTWKTAYDECLGAYSPGVLLMIEMLKNHLDDPNIDRTDSCGTRSSGCLPPFSRAGTDRNARHRPDPGADRAMRQATSQLHLYRRTQNMARLMRDRLRDLTRRK